MRCTRCARCRSRSWCRRGRSVPEDAAGPGGPAVFVAHKGQRREGIVWANLGGMLNPSRAAVGGVLDIGARLRPASIPRYPPARGAC